MALANINLNIDLYNYYQSINNNFILQFVYFTNSYNLDYAKILIYYRKILIKKKFINNFNF